MREIAEQVALVLGMDAPEDVDAVEEWLRHNDDGSDVLTLADRYASENPDDDRRIP